MLGREIVVIPSRRRAILLITITVMRYPEVRRGLELNTEIDGNSVRLGCAAGRKRAMV